MSKLLILYALNMCSFFYFKYSSIKLGEKSPSYRKIQSFIYLIETVMEDNIQPPVYYPKVTTEDNFGKVICCINTKSMTWLCLGTSLTSVSCLSGQNLK